MVFIASQMLSFEGAELHFDLKLKKGPTLPTLQRIAPYDCTKNVELPNMEISS